MVKASENIGPEIFTRIAQDDEQAFRAVFHEYNARLFHTVRKLVRSEVEAEEIIQEVFLRLWSNRHTLPSIQNPPAWLFTIASNLSFDWLRKQARQRLTIPETGDNPFLDPFVELESKEIREIINEAVLQLSSSRKEIFILSRREGLSRREIADQLNISEHTVKNQLTAALKFIQDYLQKKGNYHLPLFLLLFIF